MAVLPAINDIRESAPAPLPAGAAAATFVSDPLNTPQGDLPTMPIRKLLPFATAAALLAACVQPAVRITDTPAPTAQVDDPPAVRMPTVRDGTPEGNEPAVAEQPARMDAPAAGPQLTDRLATEVDPPAADASELPLEVVPPPTGVLGAPPSRAEMSETPAQARMTVAATGGDVDLRVAPGGDQPAVSHLHGGERVEVVGRSADGQWLQVVDPHTGHPLWVYGPLTDIDGATAATLAVTEPITIAHLSFDHDPPAISPEEFLIERIATARGAVNLRAGPGIEYARVDQARAGDLLLALGRNTDGSWFQVSNLGAPGSDESAGDPVWVHAPLLDFISGTVPSVYDATAALADVAPELWPRVEWWPPPLLLPYFDFEGASDHAFEAVWRDGSAQWDWALPNAADCHDGLRIFLDELPQQLGIEKFVLTLTDPPVARNLNSHAPGDFVAWRYHAQPDTERKFNLIAWPDWEPTVGDRYAVAGAECVHMDARFGTATRTIACDVYPLWGQPGQWLDGAVNIVLAQTMGTAGFVGDNDHDGADAWLDSTWPNLAILMPLIDYTAVGPSICAHVSRSE